MKRNYTQQKLAFSQGFRIQFEAGSEYSQPGTGRWLAASSPCWANQFNFRIHPDDLAAFNKKNAQLPYTPYAELKPGDTVIRVDKDGTPLLWTSGIWERPRTIKSITADCIRFTSGPIWHTGYGCRSPSYYLKVVSAAQQAPASSTVVPPKARPHAELIKAWADGAEIEYQSTGGLWESASSPQWHPDRNYRIKPEPVAPVKKQPTLHDYEAARQRRLKKHTARRIKLVNAISAIEEQVQALDKQYKEKAIRANRLTTQHVVPTVPTI